MEGNFWLGNFENVKHVVKPILEVCGLPGNQTCGFVEDSYMFMNCRVITAMPQHANINLIPDCVVQRLTGMTVQEWRAMCSSAGTNAFVALQEKALAALKKSSISMMQFKLFLVTVQFTWCWKCMDELRENDHAIRLIKQLLSQFEDKRLTVIRNVLQGPAAAAIFGRLPENAMPNPWIGGLTPEWLDEAKEELDNISENTGRRGPVQSPSALARRPPRC